MSARCSLQWIVVIFVIVGGVCLSSFASPVYTIYSDDPNSSANPVHTYGGQFNLDIPADPDDSKGWMVDAVIEVPDHGTINDIDVGISLTHDNVFDLQIFLVSPSGTVVCLNTYNPSEEYFQGEDYVDTVFDDEAEVPIGQAQPPFPGRYQPENPLSAFDGEDAQGTWRLLIYDAYYADTGSLESFEIIITVLEPATALILIFGIAFATLIRPRG